MKYLLVLLMIFLPMIATADFHFTDRPSFGFHGGGINHPGNWTLSGTTPISLLGASIGAKYISDGISDDETSRTHLRVYSQIGKYFGKFNIHGYGRYGRESVMLQKNLMHGGINVEYEVFKIKDISLSAGLGTWAENQDLLSEYEVNAENNEGVDFGPRGHLTLKNKYLTANTTFKLNQDKTYRVHSYIDGEIPVGNFLKIEQLFIAVSGGIDYYSETKHIEIDPLNYNWKHELRIRF